MPLYEYECEACGHRFEVIQKFSDALQSTCPKCGGVVHKLQSAPAFQLKGSGWYLTDYAKKNQGGGERTVTGKKDSGKEAVPGGTAETQTSSKTNGTGSPDSKATTTTAESTKPVTKPASGD